MSTTVDQIHHIRDMFYQQDKNTSEIASETGLNWKTVKKYVDMADFNSLSSITASLEAHESKLDPFKPLIDEWLQADKLAPRKQRHTAKRIFKRLKDETDGFNCSYRLVKTAGSITKPSILCLVFLLVTAVFYSLITVKTWSACWKIWLLYLSTSAEFPPKSGLIIPEPLSPKSLKAADAI